MLGKGVAGWSGLRRKRGQLQCCYRTLQIYDVVYGCGELLWSRLNQRPATGLAKTDELDGFHGGFLVFFPTQ